MADPEHQGRTPEGAVPELDNGPEPIRQSGDIKIALDRDLVWPAAIVVGLILVVVVNLAFIFVAVSGADPVVPSYSAESR